MQEVAAGLEARIGRGSYFYDFNYTLNSPGFPRHASPGHLSPSKQVIVAFIGASYQ